MTKIKHYGDITMLNGADLPVVDVITGGSPCQNLSIAGNRAGLAGERSGLFLEQIRIVKEMREHDRRTTGRTGEFIRPRYMVWENVPGAFSSNGGRDFQSVLTESIKIVEPQSHDVPMPEKNKWPHSGCLYDELGGWSVAWRLHDAQFWGVPQRRKRISVVADFGGLTAPEILFERKGVSGDIESGGTTGEGTAGSIESGTYPSITRRYDGSACVDRGPGIVFSLDRHVVYENHSQDSRYRELGDISETVSAKYGTGGNNTPLVCTMQSFGEYKESEIGSSLKRRDHKDASDLVCEIHKPVRRYTPLECERLQGYPDGWTYIGEWTDSKGKNHKDADSPRYKALGNSIALPFWFYLLRRISAQYERPATLGSLFDGIGGFPLCWERCNGPGTAIWASEIEEFSIAVTKRHFPEED